MEYLDIASTRKELVKALGRPHSDRKIAIFGAGDSAVLSGPCFTSKIVDPEYFIDDTPAKHGTFLYGKRIINFKEAHVLCKSFQILICSLTADTRSAIYHSMEDDPIEAAEICTLDEYVFCTHANEVLAVYDLLEDDLSKVTYANMVLSRMERVRQNQSLLCGSQYFALQDFITVDRHEVFVDCGAYVGDTVEKFLIQRAGNFKKIFAFEPYNRSFQAMSVRIERLKQEWAIAEDKIVLIQAGIGEKNGLLTTSPSDKTFGSGYTLFETASSSVVCNTAIFSIDEYFAQQPITFLKADIEGFEEQMLAGGVQVLQRDKPKLAICIYHNALDMYRVALKVRDICPQYKLFVRQHAPNSTETVLYATCARSSNGRKQI